MKKRFKLLVILLALFILPISVLAKTNYNSQNLKEILASEGIEEAYKDYSENDKQVTIYMFRGSGCQYCRAFLNYLNSITEQYGKYFKVVGYEVWNDEKNAKLMESVGKFLEQEARGVPYIIIGEDVYAGYNEAYNDAIVSSIMNEYDKDAEDRYDVFEAMDEQERKERVEEFIRNYLPIILNFVFACAIVVIVLVYANKRFNKLEEKLSEITSREVHVKEVHVKEEKEETKKKNPKKNK